jgi:molecular chaperone DnaK (HSP70)
MAIMREAAMDAGIITSLQSASLVIATEPEAAALAAQQRKDLMGLTAGGKFMVIDMGGGTVDMTIHKVDSVLGGEMTLSEVTHRECLPEV